MTPDRRRGSHPVVSAAYNYAPLGGDPGEDAEQDKERAIPVELNAVTVRPMVAEDVPEVLAVQRAAFGIEAQLYGDPLLPPLVETVEQLLADLAGSFGLVALAGGRLIGSVRARLEGRTLHIGRLAVAPDQQGRGLGALLLERAEQVAPAAEALLFTGHLSASNLRLYARAGYVEQRRAAVDDRVTLVYLRKQLS